MAENPVLGEAEAFYDNAIQCTFADHGIAVIDNNVGWGAVFYVYQSIE